MGRGFLVPPWWQFVTAPPWVSELVAIMLGFFICSAVFAFIKASRQTYWCWHRLRGKLTTYIFMVWLSWTCGVIQSSLNYAYLHQTVGPSFWLFFFQVLVWYIQIQTLLLIMVNRVSLIMYSPANAYRLKIGVLIIITVLNIGVMIAWVPAQLQINKRWEWTNQVYHRVEKSIFTFVDASINLFFIYLVRTKLVNPGLKKYRHLFRFNIVMVFISISLDITVIGLVSLGHSEIYVEFRAMSAMIKLHIEMTIADFIAKIVKSSHVEGRSGELYSFDAGEQTDFVASGTSPSTANHTTSSGSQRHRSITTPTRETTRVPTTPPFPPAYFGESALEEGRR